MVLITRKNGGWWWSWSSITLKTNWTNNGSQSILDLKAGANITLTDDGVGWITMTATGWGDMYKSVYDVNNNGIVDNSQALWWQAGSYYLDRANHTGTQTASTISDFSTTVSANSDVSANTSARHTHSNKTILDNTTASYTTAEQTKLWHITVTQAVDLDQLETRVNELDAAVILKGTWDASSGVFPWSWVAQAGWSYIVSVAGTVNSVSFWINDRIIAITDNASTSTFASNRFKADYTDQVLSVAGKTGTVTLDKNDVWLGNVDNTTDINKPVSTATQTALDNKADIWDIPTLTSELTNDSWFITSSALSGYVPNTRTLTINGTAYDLSTDRTWSVGTVTSVAALTLGTTGTDLSSTVATGTTTPVITLNVPTASALNRGALSSTDWSTFNSKESALTFSTGLTRATNTITSNLSTGISGGQSVIGGTASGNDLTLSSTSHATKGKILFGNSAYDEVNNRLGIGISSPVVKLHVLTGTYIYPASDTNYVAQNSGQYVAEYIGTNTEYAGFLVRGTGAGTQPFVQYYNSSTGKAWTQMMTTAGDLNILKGSALGTTLLTLGNNLNVGIAKATPTARLHLGAGTATAETAPLKLTSGTNLTTPEDGAFEFDGTNLYFTVGGVRKTVTLV